MLDCRGVLRTALADRYELQRPLGQGGMASVYLAQDLRHHRAVAIKVLRPEVAQALGVDRFLREIEIAALLQHPLILPVFDSGAASDPDGRSTCLWYAMPCAEGESLRDRLSRETQLSIDESLRIAREIAEALSYAHARGVIHRDIKPENILFSGGHAVIADFGIARAVSAAGGARLTETGLSLGTPVYMSPEQAADSRQLDQRTDLYSLGCVLYEMLAGTPPFSGPTPQAVMARHALDPVPALRTLRSSVPASVERAITRALAKVPADRHPDLAAFATALEQGESDSAEAAHRPRARRWAALSGAALVAVLLLLIFLDPLGARLGARRLGPTGESVSDVRSLAVLPLENLSADSSLGDALTDALITDLGQIGALRVISRSAVMRYKGSALPAPDVARLLGVDAVLEGGVRRDADSVHLDLRLISAASGYQLWSRRTAAPGDRLLAISSGVSQSLASALQPAPASGRGHSLRGPPTTSPEAYDEFLRGRIRMRTETDAENSVATRHFERAIALDPDFADAYAGLAWAYGQRIFQFAPRDTVALERALVAAEKALRLNPDLADAHYARAWLLWSPAGHFAHEQAIQEYRRAIELNPSMAEAHDGLGIVYWHIGLFDKAVAEFQQVKVLDPGNRLAQHRIGMVSVYQGKYEEGLAVLRQVPREFNPSLVTYHFAWTLFLAGHIEEASRLVDEYLRRAPEDPGGVVTSVRALIHARSGNAQAAERDIERVLAIGAGFGHFHHAAYNVASAYAILGKPARAIEWLRTVAEDGLPCYPLFTSDRNLDNLRGEAGFRALLEELRPQWERWMRTL